MLADFNNSFIFGFNANNIGFSVSVKRRHSVFDAENFGQNAQKRDSASSDAKDFPVDAQFHMVVRQVDAVIA